MFHLGIKLSGQGSYNLQLQYYMSLIVCDTTVSSVRRKVGRGQKGMRPHNVQSLNNILDARLSNCNKNEITVHIAHILQATCFSHADAMAQRIAISVCLLVGPPLCFRLKYLNYWMDCRGIL